MNRKYKPQTGDVILTMDDRRLVRSGRRWIEMAKRVEDSEGNVYITDPNNGRVRKFPVKGTYVPNV